MGTANSPSLGIFPFGQPNTARPVRMPTSLPADALVIGVYPSAFHVGWRAPRCLGTGDGRTRRIAAMAVDVEPTVFWDGAADDFALRRSAWMTAVGFVEGDEPGQHGHVSRTSPSTNGSSGAKLARLYLDPLGIDSTRTAFTDIYPVFMVKPAKDEQGARIHAEYDPIAAELGKGTCSLPKRIEKEHLPDEAAKTFGDRLIADLVAAAPRVVIGLGEEVWRTLQRLPALKAKSRVDRFEDFYSEAYGEAGTLTIAAARVPWLSLGHPGLLRGDGREVVLDPAHRTNQGWMHLHTRWASRMRQSKG